jgi:hypothetical protein
LRVKDIDFKQRQIVVREGKGGKDRVTMLPLSLVEPLSRHLERVRSLHEQDLSEGYGEALLPHALARKYPGAGREWGWQYVSLPRAARLTRALGWSGVITSWRRPYRKPSGRLSGRRGSTSRGAATPSAIASPLTFWKTATTSEPCKSY